MQYTIPNFIKDIFCLFDFCANLSQVIHPKFQVLNNVGHMWPKYHNVVNQIQSSQCHVFVMPPVGWYWWYLHYVHLILHFPLNLSLTMEWGNISRIYSASFLHLLLWFCIIYYNTYQWAVRWIIWMCVCVCFSVLYCLFDQVAASSCFNQVLAHISLNLSTHGTLDGM